MPYTISHARYATLEHIPGYAMRTTDLQVLFADYDGHLQTLTDHDAPHLILLGTVALADEQALFDRLAGGAAHIACSRKSER